MIQHNARRLEKTCFSKAPIGDPIKVYKAPNDLQECKFIIGEIKNLVAYNGMKYSDIAILYRINSLSRCIEDQLMANGIPYQVVAGLSFYERKEIKDVVAILKSASNPEDDMAFKRVLGIMPGVGKTSIENLRNIANQEDISLYSAISKFDGKSKAPLYNVSKMIDKLTAFKDKPITEMIKYALEVSGYVKRLTAVNTKENEQRVENIDELLNIAQQFEEVNPKDTLESFLDRVSLSSDSDGNKDENRVKLMTIHAAKGLEFPVVFVVSVEENILPHKNCQNDVEIEEERRLLYVAVTRAEKNLYITHSASRQMFGKIEFAMPSRFLSEIPSYLKMEIW